MGRIESGSTSAKGPGSLDCRECADIFSGRCAACERRGGPLQVTDDPLNSATLRGWIAGIVQGDGAAVAGRRTLLQLLDEEEAG
ncbi:MAG: hypothetical protein HXX15_17785 [Rhodopseudomonas sp.]|uniref:hypothetical protein n=1 Tax=Rhodopseudomonas sp. TaxID=1078 RepID=UPI001857688A|nr:hypothetical protein [Rhodopseudomonas sp.]NVN87933.1 hypothetical protein [Rhodopseudomonas sp.]